MENSRYHKLVETLTKTYKENKFNGIVKIGIEVGQCSSIIVQNKDDKLPMSPITKEYEPENYLKQIPSEHYGSIVYSFEDGVITQYAYTSNYRGVSGFNRFFEGE